MNTYLNEYMNTYLYNKYLYVTSADIATSYLAS